MLLIDGPYLAHRSYHAPFKLTTSDGLNATMIHSFLKTLKSLDNKFQPTNTILTWESHNTRSWRKDMYPDYKMSRKAKKIPKSFFPLLDDLQLFLHLLGFKQYYSPHNEADDVIAHFIYEKEPDKKAIIFTVDKDIMQLVDRKCFVWNGKQLFDRDAVIEKYNVPPELIPDYLAIQGDVSDNILGIKNYGGRKAARILKKHGCIEDIPKEDTINCYDNIMKRNKKLTTLNHACSILPLSFKNNGCSLDSLLDKYELKKIKEEISDYKKLASVRKKWF